MNYPKGRLSVLASSLRAAWPEVWFSVGSRLCCAVRAADPDYRSVHAPARAALYGSRLLASIAPLIDARADQVEEAAQDAASREVLAIGGFFEVLLLAALPSGLWIGGRGGMEVLAPGAPISETPHRSDSFFWDQPGKAGLHERIPTAFIGQQLSGPALRTKLLPPEERTLLVSLRVPSTTTRDEIAQSSTDPAEVVANARTAMILFSYVVGKRWSVPPPR